MNRRNKAVLIVVSALLVIGLLAGGLYLKSIGDYKAKRLYKSNENKMVDGVCGGIAEYFNIDPTLVRLGWVLFCALGGSGILAYIIAAIVIPRRPEY